MKELLVKLSDGNPGAVNALIQVLTPSTGVIFQASHIFKYFEDNNIIGTDIYVLASDICGHNYLLMWYLIENAPVALVKAAANKQDRSGKQILSEYINKYIES